MSKERDCVFIRNMDKIFKLKVLIDCSKSCMAVSGRPRFSETYLSS